MDRPLGSSTVLDFFADRPTPRSLARGCTAWIIVALFAYFCVRHAGNLVRHGQPMALVFGCGLLVIGLLRLPLWARDAIEMWRGKPLLRLGERGLWIREWESAGWIEWADVKSAHVDDATGKYPMLRLELRDRRKYLDRMNWIDRLAWVDGGMVAKVINSIGSGAADTQDPSIPVISRMSLEAQWDRLMAAMDLFLAAHGIPKRELSSSPEARTPSALVAQFPNGGPELRRIIAKLVEGDPLMADEIVSVARGADPVQQDAIGAGLADASNHLATLGALGWARDADARIRSAVEIADEGTRRGWALVAAPRSAAAEVV